MTISYDSIWNLLKEKGMKKQDLVENLGIGAATIAKMGKGEPVAHFVLEKICRYLGEEVEIVYRYGENKEGFPPEDAE